MAKKISLLIFLFVLSSIIAAVSSQQCIGTGSFREGSPYAINRESILSSLASNVMARGGFFYNDSIGQDSNTVYAMGMCITVTEPRVCSACMEATADELKSCPNQTAAYTWRSAHNALCFARYSNHSFFGTFELDTDVHPMYMEHSSEDIKTNITVGDFEGGKWKPFVDSMVTDASEKNGKSLSSRKYYATGQVILTTFQTVYGLMQCIPDLDSNKCKECLEKSVTNHDSFTRGKQGGTIAWPKCFFRWDMQPFGGAFGPGVPCNKKISTSVFMAAVIPTTVISLLCCLLW